MIGCDKYANACPTPTPTEIVSRLAETGSSGLGFYLSVGIAILVIGILALLVYEISDRRK